MRFIHQPYTYVNKALKSEQNYVPLVLLHIVFGIFVYMVPPARLFFFLSFIVYFFIRIILASSHKKTLEVLLACCYIIGYESFFRMTSGGLFYEISKYLVILFLLFGMFYKGLSGNGYPYFIYLILLVPAVLMASINLDYDLRFRTSVAFVLSGPVCLGISALFCYDKQLTRNEMLELILYMCLPVISMTTYLFLYTPSIKEVLSGTDSNFAASGGFGPNQVASLLGLGIFAMTVRLFLKSPTLFLKLFNGALLGLIAFRAIVTFSRGGVFAAILMIAAFLMVLYASVSYRQRQNIIVSFVLFCMLGVVTWVVSANQTNGLIENRYANENAAGIEKEDASTGRVDLFVGEIEGFLQHPFLGVGASGMKEARLEKEGATIASHNEISRLLAEHGLLGIFILLILLIKPMAYRTRHKGNLFFYAFLVFWFATINHSAMRLAAPGFVYALALINVTHEKKRPIHRQSPTKRLQ
ncbi:MAG: O-antigen ligase family protein [Gelidibacter sp.]|nr:O-antigen ligase family protein [Gelidibacter sp.]